MAFAATKRKKIKSHLTGPQQLKLTSMIDLFTILIVFLLKSYSAVELNVVPTQNMMLPTSISSKLPEETLVITVARNAIVVEGRPVCEVTPDGDILGVSSDEAIVRPLLEELVRHQQRFKVLAQRYGREFTGELTLQAHREIPFHLLRRVLATAGRAEFGEFKFATYRTERD